VCTYRKNHNCNSTIMSINWSQIDKEVIPKNFTKSYGLKIWMISGIREWKYLLQFEWSYQEMLYSLLKSNFSTKVSICFAKRNTNISGWENEAAKQNQNPPQILAKRFVKTKHVFCPSSIS
jgi:hypothetical protein